MAIDVYNGAIIVDSVLFLTSDQQLTDQINTFKLYMNVGDEGKPQMKTILRPVHELVFTILKKLIFP